MTQRNEDNSIDDIKNEIINIVNEYIILKNELFYPRASDIFSLFVLVSDDYYIIKY